jgi:hypothetical protein
MKNKELANDCFCTYKGKDYYLIQEAHCEVPLNSNYDWMALAQNREGDQITITWNQRTKFHGEDCGDACDWDNFEIIEG